MGIAANIDKAIEEAFHLQECNNTLKACLGAMTEWNATDSEFRDRELSLAITDLESSIWRFQNAIDGNIDRRARAMSQAEREKDQHVS